jgi:hypothetical protein
MSALRDQLLQVRELHGAITPQRVVDAARPEEHPLHERFEWDDSVAGEAYRRHQAHDLIRSVRVSYVSPKGQPETTRAFVAVPVENDPQPEYQLAEEVALDPVKRAIVVAQMEREWRTLRARYGHLTEFLALVAGSVSEEAAA